MRAVHMVIVAVLSTACLSAAATAGTGGCMGNVENGLVDVSSPAEIFTAGAVEGQETMTLSDRMEHYNVPGVSMAVVDDLEIVCAKAYGLLDAGGDRPVTTESIFEAASTSKMITGVLVLHYVERGVFDLDEDVNTYLTSWKLPETEFTREKKVTIRRLLTHQAGLPSTNFEEDDSAGGPSLLNVLNGEPPASNAPATPDHPLDSAWQYSNLGCIVLQLMLEDTLGRPLPDVAAEIIFEPLRMTSSTFVYPLPEALRSREALPHDREGVCRPPEMHTSALGHAGLMTTPTDLALFMIELMRSQRGESDVLLTRETAELLFTPQVAIDPALFGVPLDEGLGVFLLGSGDALVFFHQGGNTPGANCWPFASLESGKAVAIMTNGMNGELLFMEILSAVVREYGWPLPW